MKKIKLYLDYNCYPIWLYDENGILEENDLPNELKKNKLLDKKLLELQTQYDSLFTNNQIEFKYNGFNDDNIKKEFLNQFKKIQNQIESELKNKYRVVNKIKI